MPLDSIQAEIVKREDNKEELFNSILREGKQLFDMIKEFKTADTVAPLPIGVAGRRLGDKIHAFKEKLDSISTVKESSLSYIFEFEEYYNVMMNHIKEHSMESTFPETSENDSKISKNLAEIKKEFEKLVSLQYQFKIKYITHCKSQFVKQYKLETNPLKKAEIQRNIDTYKVLGEYMTYAGILRLKNLNTKLDIPISVAAIGVEYKTLTQKLSDSKNELISIKSAQIKLKESLSEVSEYEKTEKKAVSYLKERDKHSDNLNSMDEDSRNEVENFIKSYDDLYKETCAKLSKIQGSLFQKYGIKTVEDYQSKHEANRMEFAKIETKSNRLEKRCKLLHDILSDIHKCKQTMAKSKNNIVTPSQSGTNISNNKKKTVDNNSSKLSKVNPKISRSSGPNPK